jgi:hypothetical protein
MGALIEALNGIAIARSAVEKLAAGRADAGR